MAKESKTEWHPRVSVVIPAKNEEENIAETIESVRRTTYSQELVEIIVVDNGSDDNTVAEVERTGETVVKHPGVLVGAVRNRGADLATGSILVFLDADVVVKAEFLHAAVDILKDQKIGAVGGICTAPKLGNWVERAWVVERAIEIVETESLSGATFVLRKTVFQQVGRFSETLTAGEDDELTRRIVRAGYRVNSIRACDVEHMGYPSTLSGVFQRQMWHGRSQLESAKSFGDPILLLTHGFASGLVALPLTAFFSQSTTATAGVVSFLFMLCGIASFAKERKSKRLVLFRFIQRSVLYCAFFSGRSIGLFSNYWRRIARRVNSSAGV